MAVAYDSKPGFVIFEFQHRSIAEVGRGRGQARDDDGGVGCERRFPVDDAIDAMAIMADALAVKDGFPLRGIALHRGILRSLLGAAAVGKRDEGGY
jgi:hypothetical protein